MVNNAWNGQQLERIRSIQLSTMKEGQHQGHYLEEEVHSSVRSARKMI